MYAVPESQESTRSWRMFQLTLLAISTWAVSYSRFTLGPLQETMRLDLALSDSQTAWLQGPAVAIPMALGAIPLGLLVDRYARNRLLLFFVALNLVSVVLTAFAFNLVSLYCARCILGVALAGTIVTAYSMVGDLYAPGHRGRATMAVAVGEVTGGPVAFALGGMLLAMSIMQPDSWRSTLLLMSVLLIPTVFLIIALRELPRTGAVTMNSRPKEAFANLCRYRAVVLPLLLARIMVWIADGAVLVWGAPTFSRNFALPPERVGAIIGASLLISGLLGPVLGGLLADFCQRRGGPRRTMAAMAALSAATTPAALFAVMPSATTASVVLTAFLTLGFTIGTAAIALATIVIPGDLRGLFGAVQVTVAAVFCIGVAPVLVSALSVWLGGPAMIGQALAIVCCVTSALGAMVFGIGMRGFPGLSTQRLANAR